MARRSPYIPETSYQEHTHSITRRPDRRETALFPTISTNCQGLPPHSRVERVCISYLLSPSCPAQAAAGSAIHGRADGAFSWKRTAGWVGVRFGLTRPISFGEGSMSA